MSKLLRSGGFDRDEGQTDKKSILIDDKLITYELNRKNVKNINLRIRQNGTVHISASPIVPDRFIEELIVRKKDFIFRSISHFDELAEYEPKPKQFISGEAFYMLGHTLRLNVSQGQKNEICTDGVYIYLWSKDPSDYESKNVLLRDISKVNAKRCLAVSLPTYILGFKNTVLLFRAFASEKWKLAGALAQLTME